MNVETAWFVLVGALLITVAVGRGIIARLPLSGAMVYLAAGFVIGPGALGLLPASIGGHITTMRVVTEIGLVVSLFSIGLHLRVPLSDPLWWLPLRLGVPAMAITVAIVFVLGFYGLGLPAGPSLVLAAALAPTDPVLANELRVTQAGDDETVRFALSGEGGCNDGAAYPVALAGLALCGFESPGSGHAGSFAAAIVWGVVGAMGIGCLSGAAVVRIVAHLRTRYDEAVGLEGFLALGLMSICYGVATAAHTFAFVAVFCAGVALRHQELRASGSQPPDELLSDVSRGERHEAATNPETAYAVMAENMMGFAIEIERIVELALMLLIGSAVSAHWRESLAWHAIWPALALILVARPAGVWLALAGSRTDRYQRALIGWMGIRGVGAFYYLLFAIEHARDAIRPLVPVVLATIVLSVVAHGASATPLLHRYFRRQQRLAREEAHK